MALDPAAERAFEALANTLGGSPMDATATIAALADLGGGTLCTAVLAVVNVARAFEIKVPDATEALLIAVGKAVNPRLLRDGPALLRHLPVTTFQPRAKPTAGQGRGQLARWTLRHAM